MAEELNVHLPVPETKFNGSDEEKLGQLIVTPEVAKLTI